MNLNTLPQYLIQEWLFSTAKGQFEIDLGESGVEHQHLNDISFDAKHHMNYGCDAGSDNLRDLLANYYHCTRDNVCITHGGQEALYLFYQTFLTAGDHVITFSPGWSQSWVVPKRIGCDVHVHPLNIENNFALDIAALEDLVNSKTKLMIINYPNNPTGVDLDKDSYDRLINFCNKHDIFLLNDEEYLFQYPKSIINKTRHSAAIGSLSKVYGFPSTRIGWCIGPEKIIQEMVNYKRYVSVCNSPLCESLAFEILSNKDHHISRFQRLIESGKEILLSWCLDNKDDVTIVPSANTPYAYIKLSEEYDSTQFCNSLLEHKKVLIMPASVFGHDANAVRITFARSPSTLLEGLQRIKEHMMYLKERRV